MQMRHQHIKGSHAAVEGLQPCATQAGPKHPQLSPASRPGPQQLRTAAIQPPAKHSAQLLCSQPQAFILLFAEVPLGCQEWSALQRAHLEGGCCLHLALLPGAHLLPAA